MQVSCKNCVKAAWRVEGRGLHCFSAALHPRFYTRRSKQGFHRSSPWRLSFFRPSYTSSGWPVSPGAPKCVFLYGTSMGTILKHILNPNSSRKATSERQSTSLIRTFPFGFHRNAVCQQWHVYKTFLTSLESNSNRKCFSNKPGA